MKKILFCFLLLLFSQNYLSAQWFEQNSGTTNDLNTVFFINVNTGFAAGMHGAILKTTTGGVNWYSVNSDTGVYCYEMTFLNASTGIIVGRYGLILKTTNEGNNWVKLNPITTRHLYAVNFYNNLVVICAEYGSIIRSTNAGVNWSIATNFTENNLYDVSIPAPEHMYSSGYGTIIKSINQGSLWIPVTTPCFGEGCIFYTKMQFFDANTGYFAAHYVGGPSSFRKTTDGGLNFTSSAVTMRNFHFIDLNNGIKLYDDTIGRTTNAGLNWVNYKAPGNLNDIFMNDLNVATVVGENGRIMRTTTGGIVFIEPINSNVPESFTLKQNYPNPFNPSTNIEFKIAKNSNVKITVFDILGKNVATLVNQNLQPGSYKVEWNAENNPSGIYFYKLETESFSQTKKMMLIK